MAKAGDIDVTLRLDSKGFLIQTKKAADHLSKLEQAAGKHNKSAKKGREHTRSWASELRDYAIVLGLARSALENLNDLIFGLPRYILQQNAVLERNTALIEGMSLATMDLAEAQEYAKEKIIDLIDISSRSPFAIESVIDSFTKLKAGGIENTTHSLEALINTMSKMGSTSEQLKRGSIAIQQMMGKGVISMEELRQQLGEAVPNIMPIMSQALNLPIKDMVRLIATGTVEAGKALDSMFAEMYYSSTGFAAKMSNTYDGLFNQLKNEFTILAKESGDAGFFEQSKDTLRESLEIMRSPEFKYLAQDLGEGLAYATKQAFELIKLVGEFASTFAMIGAALLGKSMLGGFVEKSWTAFNSLNQIDSDYTNKATQRAERLARIREKLTDRYTRHKLAAEDIVAKESKRKGDMSELDEIRRQRELMASIDARYDHNMAMLDKQERDAKSRLSRMKNMTLSGFDLIGGWSTVATVAIIGVIALYDQLIGKQERAAKNLFESRGLEATESMLKAAKAQLDKKIERMEYLKDTLKNGEFVDTRNGRVLNGTYETEDQLKKERLKLDKEIRQNQEAIKNSYFTLIENATSMGKRLMNAGLSETLQTVTSQYSSIAKQISEKYKDLPQEEATKMLQSDLSNLRHSQFEKISAHITPLLEGWKAVLKGLQGQDVELLTPEQVALMGEAKGRIAELNSEYKKALEFRDKMGSSLLPRTKEDGGGELDKFTKKVISLSRAISGTRAQNKYLITEKERGIELAKILTEIELDAFGKISDEQKVQLEELAVKLDLQKKEGEQIKENLKLYEQARVRLGNNLTQMAKKIGTAKAKTDNPFLGWVSSSEQTLEVIAQIRKQMLDAKKDFPEEFRKLSERDEKDLAQLEGYRQEHAYLTQKYDITHKIHDLEKSMMTTHEAKNYEYAETMTWLAQAKSKLDEITDPAKRKELQTLYDTLTQVTAMEYISKDPFQQWMKSARELRDEVGQQLIDTMSGFFDATAECIVDTEASFGDMIDSLTKSLQKFLVKMAMMQALNGMFKHFGMGNFQIDGAFSGASAASAAGASSGPTFDASFGNYSRAVPQAPVFAQNMGRAAAPQAPATTFNLINQTGMQADAQMSAPRLDGEKYIVDVVMKAAARPGKFRTSLKGSS